MLNSEGNNGVNSVNPDQFGLAGAVLSRFTVFYSLGNLFKNTFTIFRLTNENTDMDDSISEIC